MGFRHYKHSNYYNKGDYMNDFEQVKENMSADGRFLRFCPTCKTKRFVKTFRNDDFADFYCYSCQNYHKKSEPKDTTDIIVILDALIIKYAPSGAMEDTEPQEVEET